MSFKNAGENRAWPSPLWNYSMISTICGLSTLSYAALAICIDRVRNPQLKSITSGNVESAMHSTYIGNDEAIGGTAPGIHPVTSRTSSSVAKRVPLSYIVSTFFQQNLQSA